MNFDIKYMHRCLQLAEFAAGNVSPNPMVGAVLVCQDQIIGEGYHQRFGHAHAEPNAINSVRDLELLQKSTLYVNLEPCSHYGKTPPCAELIIKSNIPRVVIGTLDPNPKVAGRGVKLLLDAGIEVVVGVLENECRTLNKRFFIFNEQKRPFVLLKWAQTKDGFIDNKRKDNSEKPLQISNEITRQLTHKIRSENQAILVGINTVLLDNPSLTVRFWTGKNPIRIVIDRTNNTPDNYNVKNGLVQTLFFSCNDKTEKNNVEFCNIPSNDNALLIILNELYKRNINSVLVEGGAKVLNIFIKSGLWDEANVEVSEQIIYDGIAAPRITELPSQCKIFNNHQWLYFINSTKTNFN